MAQTNGTLQGRKIAILATDGFEQSELTQPLEALKGAGAQAYVIAPRSGEIQGMQRTEKGVKVHVDKSLGQANPEDYDALMLPGGVANPDALRINKQAVQFVRHFVDAKKPIAAICHAPWTLIETGIVEGRRVTSWPSLRTDLENAGADWIDQEVVTDKGLVTSRKPDDLPAFCAKMIEEFREGRHDRSGKTAAAE
jgi:protease I